MTITKIYVHLGINFFLTMYISTVMQKTNIRKEIRYLLISLNSQFQILDPTFSNPWKSKSKLKAKYFLKNLMTGSKTSSKYTLILIFLKGSILDHFPILFLLLITAMVGNLQ